MRWILVIIMIIIMVLAPTLGTIVDADAKEIDVSFISDPLYADVNRPINLANATHADSVISEWEIDLGSSMPNGTYYGSLTQPALFQHNVRPLEIKPGPDTYYDNSSTSRYTSVIVSAHFNWSKQVLMSGASEWWVRVPVHPDSIGDFAYLAIFKDVTNASKIEFLDDFNFFTTWYFPSGSSGYELSHSPDFIRPSYNGYMPQDIFKYDLKTDSDGDTIGDGLHSTDHIYLKVRSVLRPETDYVISYAFYIPNDSELKTYWNTGESPCGGWSSIVVGEIEIGPKIDGYPVVAWDPDLEAGFACQTHPVDVLDSSKLEIGLDLDFSFIFTQGIGSNGLFGVKINFKIPTYELLSGDYYWNVTFSSDLVTYPFFNTSRTGSQYMSFMLPFISSDTIYCVPAAGNAGMNPMYYWNFTDGAIHFYPTTGWNYSDFILFSTNSTINFDYFLPQHRYSVAVDYIFTRNEYDTYRMIDFNITLLCYDGPRTNRLWSILEENEARYNTSVNPWLRNHINMWNGVPDVNTIWGSDALYDSLRYKTIYLGYDIWQSGRGTEEQWALRTMTPSGKYTYSYHFPQIIHLTSHNFIVQTANDSRAVTPWGRYWEMAQDEWATGHYFKSLYYGFKATISYLWDGLPGIIYDGLHYLWEGMKSFGSFLYTKIGEFFGKIWDFLQDVGDHLVTFWESAKYAIAPMMMVIIISYSTKFSKTARRDAA